MASWYRYIKPARSKADRIRYAGRGEGLRARVPPKIRDLKQPFSRKYSADYFINGYKAKVMTRGMVAKLFGVSLRTVHTWDAAGALPEPFIVQERGAHTVHLYLSAQIRCLLIVLRDLVKDGYVSIQWQGLPDHMEMLHEGYRATLASFNKRLKGETYGGDAPRGVRFDD